MRCYLYPVFTNIISAMNENNLTKNDILELIRKEKL